MSTGRHWFDLHHSGRTRKTLTAPPLGGQGLLGELRAVRRDTLGVFQRVALECGGIGGFRIGPQPAVVVGSHTIAQEILVDRPDHFGRGRVVRKALRPVLGDGLLTSEGELHARQRRLILPHFTPRRIGQHADVMVREATRVLDGWPDGGEIDLLHEMNILAMNIIGEILFRAQMQDESTLAEAITDVFEWEMHAIMSPLAPPVDVPTPRNLRMKAAKRRVARRVWELIAQRRASGADDGSLLSLLLAARYEDGTAMSDQQLFDEVLTLWGAAHETSADAQAWALYLLARHPEVYRRLQEEVDSVLGERAPTQADLARLPYSLQVFKEALRLYPPAAAVMRMAERETTLGGYRVPRGTLIFLAPYLIHRQPDVFPDPERFDPDRFERDRERALPKLAFLPFAAGRHVCVGNHLALMEGQLLTAVLAQRIHIELPPQPPAEPELVINLRPRNRIRARVRRRTAAACV